MPPLGDTELVSASKAHSISLTCSESFCSIVPGNTMNSFLNDRILQYLYFLSSHSSAISNICST